MYTYVLYFLGGFLCFRWQEISTSLQEKVSSSLMSTVSCHSIQLADTPNQRILTPLVYFYFTNWQSFVKNYSQKPKIPLKSQNL